MRAELQGSVPPAGIEARPPAGVLPRLPVLLAARGQAPIRFDLPVLGRSVQVFTRPEWSWSFGDVAAPGWAVGGGAAVSHTYSGAGRFRVVLRTTWHASYTVDDLGPFPLEPLRQDASIDLTVGSGRAVLLP